MDIHSTLDGALVLILLLDLALLAAGRLATCINIFAAQCVVLSLLPSAAELSYEQMPGLHAFIMLASTLGMKVVLIPWLLRRTIRTGEIHREVTPLIGFTSSVIIGALVIGGSFAVGSRLRVPGHPISELLVPTALSTLLIGLLILVSRTTAITQVLGYLVLENGVFLFGLSLAHKMPILVELGILLDVFVGVFVMAIVVYHIRREFDHMDTHALDQLKET
jgi:hydrogenase-4 component E